MGLVVASQCIYSHRTHYSQFALRSWTCRSNNIRGDNLGHMLWNTYSKIPRLWLLGFSTLWQKNSQLKGSVISDVNKVSDIVYIDTICCEVSELSWNN